MYVHLIQLDTRPEGGSILSSEDDVPVITPMRKGWTVVLRHNEVRILAQILEIEDDMCYVGQVTDFEGYTEPDFAGLRVGSYLRFREEHIFSCQR